MGYTSIPAPAPHTQLFSVTPLTASTTAVLTTTNAIACLLGVVPGTPTAPDIARNLKLTFGVGWDLGNVVVVGTLRGAPVSETFVAVAGTTVTGTKMFDAVTSATCASIPVKSTALITCVAKASLLDTDFFTISDGTHANVRFEYDTAGDGASSGNAINVSTDTTAAQVATRTAAAINAVGAGLLVLATANANGTVSLVHDNYGSLGNDDLAETVANAGFTVTSLTGGVGAGTIAIGYGVKYGINAQLADTAGLCYLAGVGEAVTLDATYNAFTPTTAANGSRVFVLEANVTSAVP